MTTSQRPPDRVVVVGGQDWDQVVTAARRNAAENAGERIVVNMGPQHPSTHGVLRLILEIEGETIVEARCGIGYLHTGIEKNLEFRTWTQGVTFVTRMDYLSPFFNETAYCLGVEKLLDVTADIPERASVIRVMMMELNRISSHLVALATGGMELGAMTAMFLGFRERELILSVFETITGLRMNNAYIRPGGVAADLPDEALPSSATCSRCFRRACAIWKICSTRMSSGRRAPGDRIPRPDRLYGTGDHRSDTAIDRTPPRPSQISTLLRL